MSGSQKTTSSVPAFVTDGGQFGVDRSKQLAELGYMPYFGPDVAALTPAQTASMDNTNQMAGAFGMATSSGTGMPEAQDYGGFSAYSSAPMFTGAQDELQQRMPGLFDAYSSMFIDPQTGRMGEENQDQGLMDYTQRNLSRREKRALEVYGDPGMAHMFMR